MWPTLVGNRRFIAVSKTQSLCERVGSFGVMLDIFGFRGEDVEVDCIAEFSGYAQEGRACFGSHCENLGEQGLY